MERTSEEKKAWLQQYKNHDKKIRGLLEQKMQMVEEMRSVKALVYDDMPHSGKKSDLSDCIVRFDELCKKIDNERVEKFKSMLAIESAIFNMKDARECEVIRKRYIEFKSWEAICDETGYSWSQVHRNHSDALKHINI